MPTGLRVTHPLTGEFLPVWVGNYVLMGYGEGAVMAVPAHDERDFAFAQKYGLPIKQVIRPARAMSRRCHGRTPTPSTAGCINSGKYDGLHFQARSTPSPPTSRREDSAKSAPVAPARLGHLAPALLGLPDSDHPLRDCGDVPVPDDQLPVVLPEDVVPDGTGNPAARCPSSTSAPVRSAASRRGARPTPWTPSSSRPGTSLRYACPDNDDGDGRCARQLLDAGRPVHRRHRARDPAPAVFALLHPGDARRGAGRGERAVHQPADPGHGARRDLLPRAGGGKKTGSIRPTSRSSATTKGRIVAKLKPPTASR
jgi:hypothetical protein